MADFSCSPPRLSPHELAWNRANVTMFHNDFPCDFKLQRLFIQSYEILRIENPQEKDELWEQILEENKIKKIDLEVSITFLEPKYENQGSFEPIVHLPTVDSRFTLVKDPRYGFFETRQNKYLLVPNELVLKMKVLECPLTK
jgi:hypothetical protein